MKSSVRILYLEDDPPDAELMRSALCQEVPGCEVQWVASETDFVAALERGGFALILADYHMPSFDGMHALALAREKCPRVPFLFLSGYIGEEAALESLKQGATDYVFKDNLKRLGPAVRRALQESRQQADKLRAEAAAQEREGTLRSFFDTAPFMMGVVELLPDDIVHLSANTATARYFGMTPEAMKGRRTSELGVSAKTIAIWLERYREAQRAARPVQFAYVGERHGRTKHLSVTVSPLPVVPGQASRFCYVAEDITDRKLLEEQFLRTQRLESIGTLASGIAHDLNNVLAPLAVSFKLFRPKLPEPEDQELLTSLESSVRRGAEIIRQVLTFARGVEGARHPLQLKQLLADLERMFRDTFPRSLEIATAVPDTLWKVTGDATQLYQVLMNLCLNARDAMPHGGRLTLSAENVTLDEHQAQAHPNVKPGHYVALSVTDTGTGIRPEVLDRVFDPFYTTKEMGKGTGLGLATALTIVKSHGGFIRVHSEVGCGSSFEVYLPAETAVPRPPGEASALEAPRGQGEWILLVDDEATIRQAMKALLVDYGYQVMTAGDGAEGLASFADQEGLIRLVITDMMMPGMDGSALIRAVRKLDPHVGVIAFSGLLEDNSAADLVASDQIVFLQKPFTAEELLYQVHDRLHTARTSTLL